MPNALIIGASRGLGLELAKNLHNRGEFKVFATTRSPEAHVRKDLADVLPKEINIIPNIDLTQEDAGKNIATSLRGSFGLGEEGKLDLVIVNAGVFKKDVSLPFLSLFLKGAN
jgi:NAD(P)-dependent dehydrogenase (short-subunit alcohol dehydrogenase family)